MPEDSQSFSVSPMAHHSVEVLSSYISVLVEVSFLEDLVHFLVSQVFSQLGSHGLELLGCDFSLNCQNPTFFWKSNDLKTPSIYSRVWLSPSFPVASLRKVSKVSPPTWSVSRSLRMLRTNLLEAAKPRLTKAFLSSTGSTTPLPSLSKISKASLIPLIS